VKGSIKPANLKQIAQQRIETLFQQAQEVGRANPKLAAEYVKTARRVAMAARIRMPSTFKRQTCKKCNALLVYGINCRVRIKQKRESHVTITCLNCGYQSRIGLRKKQGQVKIEQDNNTNETSR
jgi:ribonuclease P protein subunit RPR2